MKPLLFLFLLSTSLLSWRNDEIKLGKKLLLQGKIELLVPATFEIMDEELSQLKYPHAQRPTLVYSDGSGGINVALKFSMVPILLKTW